MSTIHITKFNGLLPRYKHSGTHGDYAKRAVDVDLSKGDLRPFRVAKLIKEGDFSNIYHCGCEITPIETCEIVTKLINGCDYRIKSGVGEATIVCGACDGSPLGLPTPTEPPVATGSASTGRTSDHRYYVYTFVDALGRESIVSPPSDHITVEDGTPVIVSKFKGSSGGCITHVNVYRSGTGYRSGSEEVQEDVTALVYVGKVDVNGILTDTTLLKNTGKLCTSMDNYPPPKGLTQIQLHESTNQLVGFEGNKVFFSTGGHSHVFPIEFEITIPASHTGNKILAIKTCRVSNVVYVFTAEDVFVISNITCEKKQCYTVNRLKAPVYTGVMFQGGITCTPYGVAYISRLGIILLTPSNHSIITAGWFTESDWAELGCHTMRIAFDVDSLFFTSDSHSYKLQVDAITGSVGGRELVELSYKPSRYIKSPTDELLLIMDGGVYQWNASDDCLVMEWEKDYWSHYRTHYTRVLVEADGLNDMWVNDILIRYGVDDQISRMQRNGRYRRHRLKIHGRFPMFDIVMGSTTREMVNATRQ